MIEDYVIYQIKHSDNGDWMDVSHGVFKRHSMLWRRAVQEIAPETWQCPGPDDIFELMHDWAALEEGKRYEIARAIICKIHLIYSKGFMDGKAIGEMNANPVPGSWRAHGFVIAVGELIAHIGAYGEVDSRHALVQKVLGELYDLEESTKFGSGDAR